eukprot:3265497-Rhodomonas_salina.6
MSDADVTSDGARRLCLRDVWTRTQDALNAHTTAGTIQESNAKHREFAKTKQCIVHPLTGNVRVECIVWQECCPVSAFVHCGVPRYRHACHLQY